MIVTHGMHEKGGEGEANYDGPLTPLGAATILALAKKVPGHDITFSGVMQRHLDTVRKLGLESHRAEVCGNDHDMFAVINGDESYIEQFWEWLNYLKTTDYKSVLIVTSRLQAYIITYKLAGGRDILGPFMTFCDAIEKGGHNIPLNISGQLHRFEI